MIALHSRVFGFHWLGRAARLLITTILSGIRGADPVCYSRAMKYLLTLMFVPVLLSADLEGSKDPPGMKRYEGSQIIGYRAPKFDEFLLPLGPPKQMTPPSYEKSLAVEGLVSRYAYLAPAGRTA